MNSVSLKLEPISQVYKKRVHPFHNRIKKAIFNGDGFFNVNNLLIEFASVIFNVGDFSQPAK